jgi:hypothetical protein
MVTRSGSYAVLAAGWALSFIACSIDIRPLGVKDPSPPTIVIATFEDGDARPEDPRFEPFRFWSYSPSRPDLPPGAFVESPLVSPGASSNFAVGLNWTVIDLPDGKPNYPGVGLDTIPTGSIDLSGYSRIVFTQRYEHEGSCQAVRNLTVVLGCDEHNTSFRSEVSMASAWMTTTIPFASFAEPSYLPPTGTTLDQCLKVVSIIIFQAQVDLADGDCASGRLSIDNLSIRSGTEPAGSSDGGVDGAAETATSTACRGTPTASPLITDFSEPIAGTPITFGVAPNITGATFAYAAPGLTPPVLSITSAGVGASALHVVADPGGATDSANTSFGFGLDFDGCIDASAFSAVRFTIAGDFGNCPIRFAATSSQTVSPANHPLGTCALANCYPPSIPLTSTGTTIIPFSQLRSGNPNLVDSTALIGVQWQLDTSVGVGCKADFIIDDLSFVSAP